MDPENCGANHESRNGVSVLTTGVLIHHSGYVEPGIVRIALVAIVLVADVSYLQ